MAAVSLLSVQALKLLVLSKPDLGIQEATLNSFRSTRRPFDDVVRLRGL